MTRQRRSFGGLGVNIRRSSAHRNAVRVLPLPVGAVMSVHSPRAMAGHPSCWAFVGDAKDDANHSRTAGWNGCSAGSIFASRAIVRFVTSLDNPWDHCKNSGLSPNAYGGVKDGRCG
jgi:hypothetical protein